MRLHTKLTINDVRNALQTAKEAGKCSVLVSFDKLEIHQSRKREGAFEVKLRWNGMKIKGDGRCWTNSGSAGSGGHYAAMYDEWGWFIAELFKADPEAIFGSYDGVDGFNSSTNYQFILDN